MIKKILVTIAPDASLSQEFDQVFHFASANEAEVCLLSVIDEQFLTMLTKQVNMSPAELLHQAKESQTTVLEKLKIHLSANYPDVQFKTCTLAGVPFVEIIKYAQDQEFNIIAIDANRGGKRHAAQFGSITRHLMRKSPTPVWTISRNTPSNIKRVAIAIDLNESPNDDSTQLNDSIIKIGQQLAKANNCSLVIIHAWQLVGQDYLRTWGRCTDLEIAALSQQEYKQREIKVQQLLSAQTDQIQPEICLIEGVPQVVIPDFLRNKNIDLLIMGTVSRTGIPGFVIGNTAESMLDAVNCSVITLKPTTFKSPVLLYK